MDYKIVADKIKELIGDHSVNQFCKDIGLHQGNTSSFLNGKKYSISFDDLVLIADHFNISLDYFINNVPAIADKKYDDNYDYIKFYNFKVSAGSGIPAENEETRMLPIERSFTKKLGHNPEKLTALEVAGDSMEPTLRNGDYVIAIYKDFLPNFVPGVYIIKDCSGLKVKRLDMDKKGNLKVIPDNKFYEVQIYNQEELASGQIIILARVVGKIGMM